MKLLLPTLFLTIAPAAIESHVTARQLATFGGFAENIAVRENGGILVTSLTTSSIQYFDPSDQNPLETLRSIPDANGISGIVEVERDLFAVAAGIWNTTARRETNASIWTIDLRNTVPSNAVFTKLLNIPETTALNGLTIVPGTSIVLGSDSALGAIYAIDISKRTYSITIQDDILTPLSSEEGLGVNGIKVHKSELYFANSDTGVFGKFPISQAGVSTGPPQVISQFNSSVVSGIDDFDMDKDGNAFIAAHLNAIYKVDCRGTQEVVVGGNQILDPTSVALGRRGKNDQKVMFASVNNITSDADHSVGSVAVVYL